MSNQPFVDVLRLTPKQRDALFERMRNIARADRRFDRVRTSQRQDFAGLRIPLILRAPEGDIVRFLACSRDISEGGMSLLHGGFVHAGSPCVVRVPTLGGPHRDLPGSIVRCALVEGRIHELGVQFQNPVDTSEFIEPRQTISDEHLLEAPLGGAVLGTESTDEESETLFAHLRTRGASVDLASTIDHLLERLSSREPDLIVLPPPPEAFAACRMIQRIRAAGFEGPILVILREPEPDLQRRLAEDPETSCASSSSDLASKLRLVAPPLLSAMEADKTAA